MELRVSNNSFFVFDLDDTLFPEIDFLKSAYRQIATGLFSKIKIDIYESMWSRYNNKENVFAWIVQEYGESVPDISLTSLLKEYREHIPVIQLAGETAAFLQEMSQYSIPAGIITDGRSITQRNKLRALGIDTYFQEIIISEEFGSEKPDERNYIYFENKYPGKDFYFFGDNTAKDFVVPAKLGWKTICLKDTGMHVHQQDFGTAPVPDFIISNFQEIRLRS